MLPNSWVYNFCLVLTMNMQVGKLSSFRQISMGFINLTKCTVCRLRFSEVDPIQVRWVTSLFMGKNSWYLSNTKVLCHLCEIQALSTLSQLATSNTFPPTGLITCYNNYGPLARYVKLQIAHTPGMPGTSSPPPRLAIPTCMTHVPWCRPVSLTSSFLWSRYWGKYSRLIGRLQ